MLDVILMVPAGGLYLLATMIQWRHLKRGHPGLASAAFWVALAALLLHGCLVWEIVHEADGARISLLPIFSSVTFCLALLLTLLNLKLPLNSLILAVFPIAAVGLSLPALMPADTDASTTLAPGLGIHVGLSLIAYAVLGLAALQAGLVLFLHYRLKHPQQGLRNLRLLPPLQTTETLLFELIWLGAILLTLAIVSGALYVDDLFAQHLVHKTVLTLLSWLLFALLLFGHYAWGWRGRPAARLTLIAALLLALGFMGSKFVLEVLLQRQ